MRATTMIARWGLLAVAGLMGALLLATGVGRYVGAVRLADVVALNQADTLTGAIHAELRRERKPPTDAVLREIVKRHHDLRYVRVMDANGATLAQAGQPPSDPRLRPPQIPLIIGDEARLVTHLGPPPPGVGPPPGPPPGVGPPHGPLMLIVYTPAGASAVLAASLRDLVISVVGAVVLLFAAVVAQRVARRADTAEHALERQRHLAALGEMSAVMAHEIRNPLAALKGHAQLLEERLDPGSRDHVKATRVVRSAQRLEALTNDLLEFARSSELHLALEDPARLLHEAAEHLPPGRVCVDIVGVPPPCLVDGARLQRALCNLIDNAAQASDEPVIASVRHTPGALIFEVRDRGPGVADDVRDSLFEPFVTGRTRGTGLGLAIVERIVHLHHGTLELHDPPDGGALFRVTLPLET